MGESVIKYGAYGFIMAVFANEDQIDFSVKGNKQAILSLWR